MNLDLSAADLTFQNEVWSFSTHVGEAGVKPAGRRQESGLASSTLKINGTEARQRLDEIAITALGPSAREPGSNLVCIGPGAGMTAMPRYLNNRAASIYGGSNEIQRDIIAGLVLGV